MKFRKSARRDTPEVNLIAFIDVLLVILIFLMVSTTFSKFSALKLSLPTATTNPEQAQPKTVSVAIDASGSVTVDSRRLGLIEPKTLAAALKQVVGANTDSVVEIHADAMATHQSVVNVMEAARLAGLQRLSFATRNPPR
ncbi:MAG: biopolymer transporter ExbD [Burkholderiaceae bacterium]|jgi:biopolymer transport protein ExbD|nr:biopolymer transporter ExbD [Burkholderiaceae bacterium]